MNRDRFKDAPWFMGEGEDNYCVIGGAGGIGSWLTVGITRMGMNPVVYDFDNIEEHNIGGQLFRQSDIGKPKVVAIQDIVRQFCNTDISVMNDKYDKESMTSRYMFMAFDNMQARKDMFHAWYEANKDVPDAILIDGRLTMEQMQIFCVNPDNATKYAEEHLFDDTEVADAPCTMKQTSHTAMMIAGQMIAFMTNHLTNFKEGMPVRNVPYMWEHFTPLSLITES